MSLKAQDLMATGLKDQAAANQKSQEQMAAMAASQTKKLDIALVITRTRTKV